MKKFFKGSIITTTAFLLFLGGMTTVTPVLPEDETGIVTDTDINFDGDEDETPDVQPLADDLDPDEKEKPLF